MEPTLRDEDIKTTRKHRDSLWQPGATVDDPDDDGDVDETDVVDPADDDPGDDS